MSVFGVNLSNKTVVAVCMSTFNGEKFLSDQLDSLLNQNEVQVDIFIRDDGSTDGTVALIEQYASVNKNFHLLQGENKGFVKSFLDCLDYAGDGYEYYAFCDQDDVWYPNKLKDSLETLGFSESKRPRLVFTEFNYCDENLNIICKSHLKNAVISKSLFLYDNMCSGNTMLFNRALRNLVLSHDLTCIYYHDWWVALVCAFFGDVLYLDKPTLSYRRLSSSVSINGVNPILLVVNKLKMYLWGDKLDLIERQISSFINEFGTDLAGEDQQIILFASHARLKKVFSPLKLRQRIPDELFLRILFLFGRL